MTLSFSTSYQFWSSRSKIPSWLDPFSGACAFEVLSVVPFTKVSQDISPITKVLDVKCKVFVVMRKTYWRCIS